MLEDFSEEKIQYVRAIGQHKPIFQGRPQGYYDLTCCQICSGLSFCFLLLAFQISLLVLFFLWINNNSTNQFVLTWTIISIVYLVIVVLTTYFCSKNKNKEEANIIRNAIQRQVNNQKDNVFIENISQNQIKLNIE